MRLSDFYEKRRRYWFRFVEKGVKHHKVPVYHKAQDRGHRPVSWP
jgi:hypothetical protein